MRADSCAASASVSMRNQVFPAGASQMYSMSSTTCANSAAFQAASTSADSVQGLPARRDRLRPDQGERDDARFRAGVHHHVDLAGDDHAVVDRIRAVVARGDARPITDDAEDAAGIDTRSDVA